MPFRRGHHQAARGGKGGIPVHHAHGVFGDALIQLAALAVLVHHAIQVAGGLFGGLRQQQARADLGAAHAAHGVEHGRDLEEDFPGGDAVGIDAHPFHQRAQADVGGGGDQTQAGLDQAAVLAHQGHVVGQAAQGQQIQEALGGLALEGKHQRVEELVGHAHAGQALVGIGAAGLVGIEDGVGGRQLARGLVMIGDDDAHAQGLGVGHLGHGRDARVHGNEPARAQFIQPGHAGEADAVAFLEPVGQEPVRVQAAMLEALVQQGGGGHAVHVVVPVHDDLFAGGMGRLQDLQGLVQCPACRDRRCRFAIGPGRPGRNPAPVPFPRCRAATAGPPRTRVR